MCLPRTYVYRMPIFVLHVDDSVTDRLRSSKARLGLDVSFLLLMDSELDYTTARIPSHVTAARRSVLDYRVFALRNARIELDEG